MVEIDGAGLGDDSMFDDGAFNENLEFSIFQLLSIADRLLRNEMFAEGDQPAFPALLLIGHSKAVYGLDIREVVK